MEEENTQDKQTAEDKNLAASRVVQHIKNHWLPYVLASFFLVIAAYSAFQNSILKSKIAAEKLEMSQQFETVANDHLRLTAKTFSWAVRAAMQRNNYDQVQEYFQEFIREEKVGTVALSDNTGTVKVCTNMKFEEKPLVELFDLKDIPQDKTIKILTWQSERLIITPIMALNEQLGTLYWTFAPDSLGVE